MAYTLTILGDPKGKGRPRFNGRVVYTPPETKVAECEIQTQFWLQNPLATTIPRDKAVSVRILAFVKIPKSMPKRDRMRAETNELAPTKKPDADNILKLVMDALNGVAYEDDAQVVEVSCEKRYGLAPMTHIAIREVEGSDGTQDHVKG